MRKFMLAAGAAALAIAAPGFAEKGGQGGGQDKNKGGQSVKADRGGQSARGGGRAKAEDHSRHQVNINTKAIARQDRRDDRVIARDIRREDRRDDRRIERQAIRVDKAVAKDDRVRIVRAFDQEIFPGRGRGLINGCPPGLDDKDNGCMPPGQVKNLLGARLQSSFASALVPEAYRSWYRDDDSYLYRSGDGFIYRVNRQNSLVDGLIPLFDTGSYYALGDPWPQPYNFYNVPFQYRSLYADTPDYYYRYGDGAIYRVNSGSGVVDSIVALLAGDLGVGSRMPMGYDAYNVPFAYRDRYYDTADNWYRYNDGYIYQVDPTTRLVTAVIDALV